MLDADTLYHFPISLQEHHFYDLVCDHFQLLQTEAKMDEWNELIHKVRHLTQTIDIGLVGKYVELADAFLSLVEAIKHAGYDYYSSIKIHLINSGSLDDTTIHRELSHVDGIVVPGGFGSRGMDGKVVAIKYARKNNIPFFGVCLGLQLAAVEIARTELDLTDANTQ